jgi:hypothetical protein
MKKLIYNIFILIVSGAMLSSCSGFLDREPTDYASTGFYKSLEAIEVGTSGVYESTYLHGVFAPVPFTVRLDDFTGLGMQRAENTTIGAGGGLNPDEALVASFWKNLYIIVARANSVIEGSKDYIDDLDNLAQQYMAEVRVLRTFAYYYLIATYGDVPFFTSPVTIDQYEDERTDKVVILDFILNELEEVADKLPWVATERGRVDRSFVYGLKARAALLGGSLNYGSKGKEYFTISAAAANQVIGKRSLAANFPDLFNLTGQAKSDVRNELILEHMYSNKGIRKYHQLAFAHVSRNTGQTARHPAMLLADMYECIDGKRIDESPLYDPKHPQKNRDPRFGWTLWMHGDTVSVNNGSVVTQVLEAYEAEAAFYNYTTGEWEMKNNNDINNAAAWASFCNAGSGYLWAKYSNETTEAIASQTCNVAILRYAEILLTYAEAKIELNELDNSVYEAINAVRNRAGMPDISADRIGNQDKMRQLIRRERKVELILEGQHFVDMKRWGIGYLVNEQPSYGLPLPEIRYEGLAATDIPDFKKTEQHDLNDIANYDAYKEKLKVRDVNRYWNDAFQLWPVPQLERDRNPNLSQNPGY